MNFGRGLFRAWIAISILWIIGAGAIASVNVLSDTVRGSFQPNGETKAGLAPWQVDYSRPFYETIRSPSAEKLSVTFYPLSLMQKADWAKDAKMIRINMPDGSSIYIHADYNDSDRHYIATQFWNQRWWRWGSAIGFVVLWAFVPCALLFILGYTVLWVARGFART